MAHVLSGHHQWDLKKAPPSPDSKKREADLEALGHGEEVEAEVSGKVSREALGEVVTYGRGTTTMQVA
ncbi:hypothetical protein GUJ93_ZPchr0010g8480 [Zizania palustris]|uniref:Uncharacterized protein n=1 Tax=Zizania palustris TaxID=103762 RepID=A0A8J5WCH3_ZIZPA|nr:hypothetical protein GUJ93_ZPchr0010g8480 [Zizania palustris]